MGAGKSRLVRDSPRQHPVGGPQDQASARQDAWANLVSLRYPEQNFDITTLLKSDCGQDYKLRAGSVARTKERIQCICEGNPVATPSSAAAHLPQRCDL